MRNYNKYKKYNKKKRILNSPLNIILIMIAIIAVMAIGYASLNDMIRIFGSANIKSFSIEYNLNGGTNVVNPITTYYATTNEILPLPTYTGFIFGGWYENDTFTGSNIISTPTR